MEFKNKHYLCGVNKKAKDMKNFILKLKGRKAYGTENVNVEMKADNKTEAYYLASRFFSVSGDIDSTTQITSEVKSTYVSDYIVDAHKYEHLRGKYVVLFNHVKRS